MINWSHNKAVYDVYSLFCSFRSPCSCNLFVSKLQLGCSVYCSRGISYEFAVG